MKFDFTINIPLLFTILSSAVAVIWKFSSFQRILKDFPPHRHVNDDGVIYPKDMRPDPVGVEHQKSA